MALTAEQKKEILGNYGLHETDTGSPEAQVALLTKRIADLDVARYRSLIERLGLRR